MNKDVYASIVFVCGIISFVAGNSCSPGYFLSGSSCFLCPAARYCPGGTSYFLSCYSAIYSTHLGLSVCPTCTPGNYVLSSTLTCSACAPGTYNDNPLSNGCNTCPNGLVAMNSGMSACTPCPYSDTSPTLDKTQCVCNAGFYLNSSNLCVGCAKGWYKSAIGNNACLYCGEGFYGSATMQTTCQSCDPGYYTNTTAQTVCIGCAPGTRAFSTGCDDCWPGTYSTGTQWGCTLCEAGTFSNTSRATFCSNCSLGYYSTGISCIACEKGKYSSFLTSQCMLCEVGTYANMSAMSFCWTCPRNSYVINNTNCSTCPVGEYVMNNRNPGLVYCSPCTAGMYDDFVNTSTCTACPMGMFSTGKGMSTCQMCEAGQFSFQSGLSMCVDCPLGTYSSQVILAPNLYQSCQYQWDIYLGTSLVCDFAYNPVQSLNNWYEISLDKSKTVQSVTFYEDGYCVYSPRVKVYLSDIQLTRNISFQLYSNAVFYECKGLTPSLLDVTCPYTFFCPIGMAKNMSWLYIVNVPSPRTVVLDMNLMWTRQQAWMSNATLSNTSSSRLVFVLRDYQNSYIDGDFFYVDVFFYKSDARFQRITRFTLGVTMISPVGLLEYVATQFNVSWAFKVVGVDSKYIQYVCENSEVFQSGRLLFTMKFKIVKMAKLIMQQGVFCITPGWWIQENGVNMVDLSPDSGIYVIGYSDDLSIMQGDPSCLYIRTQYNVPAISVAPFPTEWIMLVEKIYPFSFLSPLQRFTVAFRSMNIASNYNVFAALVVFELIGHPYFQVDMNSAQSFFSLIKNADYSLEYYSFLMLNRGSLQRKMVNYTDNTSTVSWVFNDIVNRDDLLFLDFVVKDYVPEDGLYTVFCVSNRVEMDASYASEFLLYRQKPWVQGYVFNTNGCLQVYVSASQELVQPPLKIAVQESTCLVCPVGTYGNGTRQTSCIACTACTNAQYYSGLCSPTRNSQCLNLTQCRSGYAVWIAGDRGNFTRLGSDAVCCRECSSMEYYNGNCSLTDYGGCFNITQCQMGYGVLVAANRGNFTQAGKDAVCTKCCPNHFWYAGNGPCLVLNDFSLCKRCKVCYHGYVQKCSMFQDAICSPKPSYECVAFAGFDVPPWLLYDNTLRCEKGQYIQNFSLGKPVCDGCSGEYIGANGMYCEPCLGYRQAYWDHSLCVCTLPTIQDFNTGDCICPPGYYIGYFDGCQICPINTYKPTSVVLNTDWYNQASSNGCLTCENGKYAPLGQTVCLDCPAFHYRLGDMPECVKCGPGWYAPFKNMSVCSRCVSGCQAGYYSDPCPTLDVGTFSNYICRTCTGLPNNSHWVEMDEFSPVYECIWACNQGYYQGINECKPCSSGVSCEPGKQIYPCTDIQDVSCEWDCVNETKPTFHSVWVKGCEWGCKDGYRIQKMDYGMFSTYECIWNETQAFWHW